MSINVFLRDRLNDQEGVWAKALGPDPGAALIITKDHYYRDASCDAANEPDSAKAANTVIFLHHNNNLETWHRNVSGNEPAFRGHLVVISTPGAVVIPQNLRHDRTHACVYKPEHFYPGKEQPPRLRAWIDQVKAGRIEDVNWTLLQPAPTERLWALRLLCEAYELEKTRQNVQVNWINLLKERDDEGAKKVLSGITNNVQELGIDIDEKDKRAVPDVFKIIEGGKPPGDGDAEKIKTCRELLEKLLGIRSEVQQNQSAQTQ
jgi:hypothetical protein